MKITAISNAQGYNSKKNSVSIKSMYKSEKLSNKNLEPSFKGYVNGKFYEDWIIEQAQKALKDSNWEKKFRKDRSNWQGYLKWHENIEDQGGLTTRVLAGILSFGTSEVLMGGLSLVGSALDDTEKVINKIKECMNDLK